MMKPERTLYTSCDLDGVVFTQVPIHVAPTLDKLKRWAGMPTTAEQHTLRERLMTERQLGKLESTALKYITWGEFPAPYITLLLLALPIRFDPYLERLGVERHRTVFNTARLYQPEIVDLTWSKLHDLSIAGLFDKERSFFRPDGVSSPVSKRAGAEALIQDGSLLIHYEDNPADAFAVADADRSRVFVYLLEDLTNGMLYSREEMAAHPNIRRVASFGQAVDPVHIAAAVRYLAPAA